MVLRRRARGWARRSRAGEHPLARRPAPRRLPGERRWGEHRHLRGRGRHRVGEPRPRRAGQLAAVRLDGAAVRRGRARGRLPGRDRSRTTSCCSGSGSSSCTAASTCCVGNRSPAAAGEHDLNIRAAVVSGARGRPAGRLRRPDPRLAAHARAAPPRRGDPAAGQSARTCSSESASASPGFSGTSRAPRPTSGSCSSARPPRFRARSSAHA